MDELITMIEQLRVDITETLKDLQNQIDEVKQNLTLLDEREASNEAATGDWVTTVFNQYDTQFAEINTRLDALNA